RGHSATAAATVPRRVRRARPANLPGVLSLAGEGHAMTVVQSVLLFALAALAEIGGAWGVRGRLFGLGHAGRRRPARPLRPSWARPRPGAASRAGMGSGA